MQNLPNEEAGQQSNLPSSTLPEAFNPETASTSFGFKKGRGRKTQLHESNGQYTNSTKAKDRIHKAAKDQAPVNTGAEVYLEVELIKGQERQFSFEIFNKEAFGTASFDGGKAYILLNYDAKERQFNAKLNASCEARINLKGGEFDTPLCSGTYAVDLMSFKSLFEAGLSTEKGFNSSVNAECGVMGPSVSTKVESLYKICFLGVSITPGMSVTGGIGAKASAGVGVVNSRVYLQAGYFQGIGGEIKLYAEVGHDEAFHQRQVRKFAKYIDSPHGFGEGIKAYQERASQQTESTETPLILAGLL